jgi:putative ABC transport system permease protein
VNPLAILAVALRALLRNKTRSLLTALGVIIGVGAVIAMTAIGAGAKDRVAKTFEAMGSNMLVVRSGSSRGGGVRGGGGSQPSLTWDDLAAIRDEVPGVRHIAPQLSTRAQVAADGQNWNTVVQGTTADFFAIRNWKARRGTILSDDDEQTSAKVALVGKTVVDNLYGDGADPVGQVIRVGNVPFEVIGVLETKGQASFGQDMDDVIIIPAATYRSKLLGGLQQYIDGSILVGAASQEATAAAQPRIEELLRRRHRIRGDAEDDFSVRNLADLASAQQEGADTMQSLLAGIALVSLLVGGIGIMNIMLVSVTERTREIGLRMAVGARARSILGQFLVEAVSLSLIGGLVGVAAGLGAARYLVARFDWPMLVQPTIIGVAVAFSAAIGIGFGLYPAYKASRLDPIQALRYE